MRKPVIAGNFKMYKTPAEAVEYARGLKKAVESIRRVDVIIAPAFPGLTAVSTVLSGSQVGLAAQDVFWEAEGAYTGEVSPTMLAQAGCSHVIIGHSERRQYFGETDATVNKKARACLQAGLNPILCLGEKLEEREKGETFQVLDRQVESDLAGLQTEDVRRVLIAYEPIWAIGTGLTAQPAQAEEAHAFIREKVKEHHGESVSRGIRILYGGSVKPENTEGLVRMPDVDGALVGGASLKVDIFAKIVSLADSVVASGKTTEA
jgi:triosephosphate isomerase